MLRQLALLLVAADASLAAKPSHRECSLAGPGFPPPSQLSHSQPLSQAIADFENDIISSGKLGLRSNNTAWGVTLFSAKENKTLYEHFYTPPPAAGIQKVDRDSVFRIGSVSKVFSVWSFLIEVGDGCFNDPITKYLPELANSPSPSSPSSGSHLGGVVYDDIDSVRWEDVTLGELASQAAGIARDPVATEISPTVGQSLGLPGLPGDEIPVCGTANAMSPCSRQEMMRYLLKQHPIYAPQQSPAYSNIAFTLLSYAQEVITGKSLSDSMTSNIFSRLGMTNSAYDRPPPTGGVIPGNDTSTAGWSIDLGETAPSGSIYSSTADMVKAGQAILQSTLLSPAQTRRWFRPHIQTGHLGSAVGVPWEIRYLPNSNQHLLNVVTKSGDLGAYHTVLAFSPQHHLGWVAHVAGPVNPIASKTRDELFNIFGDIFIPAAERQAKQEAVDGFDGTYVHDATNSSLTVVVDDGDQSGLRIVSLASNGTELIGAKSALADIYGVGKSGRLYPSQLRTVANKHNGEGTYEARLGFRATFFEETQEGHLEDPCLMAWTSLGAPTYGQVSLDDWVFEMGEDGKAKAVDVRILRQKLVKRR